MPSWVALPVLRRECVYRVFDDIQCTTDNTLQKLPSIGPGERVRANSAKVAALEDIKKTDSFGHYHRRISHRARNQSEDGEDDDKSNKNEKSGKLRNKRLRGIVKGGAAKQNSRRQTTSKVLEIRGSKGHKPAQLQKSDSTTTNKIRKGFKQGAMTAILATKIMQSSAVKVDISRYSVFLPEIILRDLAAGGGRFTNSVLSKRSSCSSFEAAVLMVDISGFTALTQQLNEANANGAELLCEHINKIYSSIMEIVREWGGDCVKFAGDALLVMWEIKAKSDTELLEIYGGDATAWDGSVKGSIKHSEKPIHMRGRLDSTITSEGDRLSIIKDVSRKMSVDLREAVSKATLVACKLHKMIEEQTLLSTVGAQSLKLHAGVGCGRCLGQVVGGVLGRWEFILTGEGIEQIALAEPAAGPTETVVTPQAWNFLKDDFVGEVVNDGTHVGLGLVRISGVKENTMAPLRNKNGSHDTIMVSELWYEIVVIFIPSMPK